MTDEPEPDEPDYDDPWLPEPRRYKSVPDHIAEARAILARPAQRSI